ncbi:sensor histidine kinase [Salipiger sp. IMCC34102]|uniref:sensor histidine kinase n=1 Tax=Salipiger sp. IMCC34102 TaxID=2510647 RepID=UPI00101CF5FB|nr:ATP-binding protein [Salipiger sp. IMCC34102]RYH00872.1 sensor histidine kinase [Salipiger sp. IMCC34102]
MTEETATGAFSPKAGSARSEGLAHRHTKLARQRGPAAWRTFTVIAGIAAALGLLALMFLLGVFRDQATERARVATTGMAEMVDGWFSHYAPLPDLLARDPRVISALSNEIASADLGWLNRELAVWKDATLTSDIYLMATDGTTVAASNAGTEVSFVGQNFSFRPYFQQAMKGETGRLFALGTTSGLRGYYLSAPVRDDGRIVGVAVIKISIDGLELAMGNVPYGAFVTDETGVVIISNIEALRLSSLGALSPQDRAEITRTRRFDLDRVEPATITSTGSWGPERPLVRAPAKEDGQDRTYLHLTEPLTQNPWTLHLLYDAAAARAAALTWSLVAFSTGLATLAMTALALGRRRRLIERLSERERTARELERRVAVRTAALETEVKERRTAETTLRQTQHELVQAGKLAALGQMSAALSHEFNQPLTAIRTYVENAVAFQQAGKQERASDNLERVLRLTERMAQLSKHLNRFARKSDNDLHEIEIDNVIDEALALLSGRVQRSETEVAREGERGIVVLGGAVRLQHVAMNLIGNAIDAVPDDRTPCITIRTTADEDRAQLIVEDNGTGIPDDLADRIFDPFFTTKEVGRGLGLGLSICYNIVHDFGGTMAAETRGEGGARVTVTLRLAKPKGFPS